MDVEFRHLHRLFYPQVPLVLCSRYSGRVSAMPVVAYASLSEKPPLVGVSCSPFAFTTKLALKARAFSLCLLDKGHLAIMERLATVSGEKTVDKLEEVGLKHHLATKVNAPVLAASTATIECSILSKRKTGDHLLLVGRVRACYASEDFTDFWAFKKYVPILYTGWQKGMTTYPEGSP